MFDADVRVKQDTSSVVISMLHVPVFSCMTVLLKAELIYVDMSCVVAVGLRYSMKAQHSS